MRKLILILGILVSLAAAQIVFGQVPEGSISYEVKVNMHRTLPPERQEMKQMLPEFNTYQDRLVFRGAESLYKSLEDESEDEFSDDGGNVRMRIRRPNIEYYFNHDETKRILSQEFFGKQYLIEDTIKVLPWKLGSETKNIQGYLCKQASYFNEERKQNIVAWYTDQLKPFLGPENYNSLPGTVLQIDINDGERTITAKKVEFTPLKKGDLKRPSSGQKTTEQEFRKIREEQMKRAGANGNVIIRNN